MPKVEYVQVDRDAQKAQPDAVPAICAALRLAREEAGLTQDELARRIDRVQSSVQKWEAGREPNLNRITDLELAMGYTRGHILRLAGYVASATSVREHIEFDPRLTPDNRDHVLAAYDVAVELSSRARSRLEAVPLKKLNRPRS